MPFSKGKGKSTMLLYEADGATAHSGCPTLGPSLISIHVRAMDQITHQILHHAKSRCRQSLTLGHEVAVAGG